MGRPQNRRPLGKPRRRWEVNNKIHLQQVGCAGIDRIDLAAGWYRLRYLANAGMYLLVP